MIYDFATMCAMSLALSHSRPAALFLRMRSVIVDVHRSGSLAQQNIALKSDIGLSISVLQFDGEAHSKQTTSENGLD